MKISFCFYVAAILLAHAVLVGCDSPQKNVTDAKEDLHEAQVKLAEAQRDSIKTADWNAFKSSSMDRIAANKVQITALKSKQYEKGTIMDPVYEQQITTLEAKNETLQRRIDDYEKYNSNWETFKREFNHDMEDIGKSLKELTVNNTK
jgi:hypothetical protein